jgi:hypothetical protein
MEHAVAYSILIFACAMLALFSVATFRRATTSEGVADHLFAVLSHESARRRDFLIRVRKAVASHRSLCWATRRPADEELYKLLGDNEAGTTGGTSTCCDLSTVSGITQPPQT